MNEITPVKDAASPPGPGLAGPGPAKLVYLFYLVSLFVGLPWLVGLITAYVFRDGAPDWVRTHYNFQIRTFWIGLVMLIIGVPLCLVGIGFAIIAFWYLWTIIRCAKGLKYLADNHPHPKPKSWSFG